MSGTSHSEALQTAERFDDLAFWCHEIAGAIRSGDAIAGSMASSGFLGSLFALPDSLKSTIREAFSDDGRESGQEGGHDG